MRGNLTRKLMKTLWNPCILYFRWKKRFKFPRHVRLLPLARFIVRRADTTSVDKLNQLRRLKKKTGLGARWASHVTTPRQQQAGTEIPPRMSQSIARTARWGRSLDCDVTWAQERKKVEDFSPLPSDVSLARRCSLVAGFGVDRGPRVSIGCMHHAQLHSDR